MDFAYSPTRGRTAPPGAGFHGGYHVLGAVALREQELAGGHPAPAVPGRPEGAGRAPRACGTCSCRAARRRAGHAPDQPRIRAAGRDHGAGAWAAEVFNCNAPDTGNMELLHLFATPEQRERWLMPLLDGEIRSCFAMTEPDVGVVRRDQHPDHRSGATATDYVINGRKWFITGAAHPHCRSRSSWASPTRTPRPRTGATSLVLVPMDTPGFERRAQHPDHAPPRARRSLRDRVPRRARAGANLLGEEGGGFAMAQARLGPGRIHHCMRTIGQCELALELMCERALERQTFGKPPAPTTPTSQDWIALVAHRDRPGAAAGAARRVADGQRRANAAAHGRRDDQGWCRAAADPRLRPRDAGLRRDGPVARHAARRLWTWGRALRFIDGPGRGAPAHAWRGRRCGGRRSGVTRWTRTPACRAAEHRFDSIQLLLNRVDVVRIRILRSIVQATGSLPAQESSPCESRCPRPSRCDSFPELARVRVPKEWEDARRSRQRRSIT